MLKDLALRCLTWRISYCLFLSASSSLAADVYLAPVSANVSYTINGSEIILHGINGITTLEILVGGWSPAILRSVEAGINSSGYSSGSGGTLAPVIVPNPEAGSFIDITRPDFVHYGMDTITAIDRSSLNYRYGSTTTIAEGVSDDQTLRYLGTLKLTASADAFGTFTIPLDPSVTYLKDVENFDITPVILHEARVTIRPRIYVNDDAGGANNGTSWANAFQNLQDALSVATVGTEVWVAAGNYRPDQGIGITPGDRLATFQLMNNVALLGGFAGIETVLNQRNPAANVTVLTGDLSNNDLPDFVNYEENSIHVVTGSGRDATAILDGFTVTEGNANGGPVETTNGGGMLASGGSPTVRKSRFFQNRSINFGGAIHLTSSGSQIVDCHFIGNQAGSGGGIANEGSGAIDVVNCSFHENSTTGPGPNDGGGAVAVQSSGSAALANCIVSGNFSQSVGGGIQASIGSGVVTMRNCTIVANSASDSSGGGGVQVRPGSSGALLENCIIYGNVNGQIEGGGGPTVNYSLVEGGFVGTQNIDADPAFVDADGDDNIPGNEDDDLRLSPSSLAIDAGSRAAVSADAADLNGDGNTSELTPYDLDGNPRIRDMPDVVDTGAGGLPVVDMGAYEVQPPFVDCNNNGIPDDLDILAGTSLDLIAPFGVPDECAFYDDGCDDDPDWSCFANWDLGDAYPDNDVNTYSVVLDGPAANVCLDVTVEINTLLLDNSASLNMSGTGNCVGDLTLAQPGGLVISNDASLILGPGQSISEPATPSGAGITIGDGGTVVVDDSAITLTGDVVIESGGSYVPQPPTETNDASLTAGNVLIRNDPDGDAPPGELILTGTMSLDVLDDLTIDGTYSAEPCPPPQTRSARSYHTPPRFQLFDQGIVNIAGTISLLSAVELLHESAAPMSVGGDFENHCVTAECVDFSIGAGIVINGSGELQIFEVAATDLGANGNVFLADFAMPSVTISSGANVEFTDLFDNDLLGQGPCTEAVYVENLVLESNVTIRINDCRVYYNTTNIDPTALISYSGCGELKNVNCVTAQPAAPEPTPLSKTRFISFVPGNSGTSTAIRITLTSLHHPGPPYTGGPTIPFTAFEGQTLWVGPPGTFLESTSSGTPFFASGLQCEPYYHDWGTINLLHVHGSGVVPSSAYGVQLVSASCNASQENYFSPSLTIGTTRWGDVETPYNPPSATVQPDLGDIGALVNKFRSALGAPIKARALIAGSDAFGNITTLGVDLGFGHIAACVDAFRGAPYPFKMGKCAMGGGACRTSTDCIGANSPPCNLYCP